MRAIFLGTPEAAVPTLDRLVGLSDIAAVVTQPDRPKGRSRTPRPSPVKVRAEELGLPVSQPHSSGDLTGELAEMGRIDVAVIVAFGQLIRPAALVVPDAGFLNVHFSLLPRWRGAAPVQRAIEHRDPRVGVSLMRLDPGLDTGPVIATTSLDLRPDVTTGDMLGVLAAAGAELLEQTIVPYVSGRTTSFSQDESLATLAPKVDVAERTLDLDRSAEDVVAKIHALSPKPGATVIHAGGHLKILRAAGHDGSPHSVTGSLMIDEDRLVMDLARGRVELIEVQPAGKRPMAGIDWARGRQGSLGIVS